MSKEALKENLRDAAAIARKTLEDHMLDTITDMESSAMDSIIRVGIVCFCIGVAVGWLFL